MSQSILISLPNDVYEPETGSTSSEPVGKHAQKSIVQLHKEIKM